MPSTLYRYHSKLVEGRGAPMHQVTYCWHHHQDPDEPRPPAVRLCSGLTVWNKRGMPMPGRNKDGKLHGEDEFRATQGLPPL